MDIFTSTPQQEKNGVKRYTSSDFYWGITPREEMEKFNRLGREKGYAAAKKEFIFAGRFDYAENYRRADFHFLLPVKKDAVILDVGSGFGNITIPLAMNHSHVVAVDGSLPLLEYSRLRAESEGLKNIDYIQVDPLENMNLPFKPKSFDAVILNGVLEWVGPARTDKSPQELQLAFLKQIRVLLKDDGILYIGIENRMFPGWLGRDPHSKLKWTSVLPRFLADMYAKSKGQPGYRTYIYSSLGYRKLLRRSGFPAVKFYYPYTTYREPNYIYSGDKGVRAFIQKQYLHKIYTKKWSLFLKVARVLSLDHFFLSSFMMIASDMSQKSDARLDATYIATLAKEKSSDVVKDDIFMKIPSPENEGAVFLAFHQYSVKPYAEITVSRQSVSAGQSVSVKKL